MTYSFYCIDTDVDSILVALNWGSFRQLKKSCPNSLIARELEQMLASMK